MLLGGGHGGAKIKIDARRPYARQPPACARILFDL